MRALDCFKWLAGAAVLSVFMVGCGGGGEGDAAFRIQIHAYPGTGEAVSPAGVVKYRVGREAEATAEANEGYVFTGWSGASDSRENSVTVKMRDHQTLTANFRKIAAGAFTDSRDGRTYRTVKIGRQTWMAENLGYDVPDNATDVCYDGNSVNCEVYGRLYRWDTAQVACPVGWRLPRDAEWTEFVDYLGGAAGAKLKAADFWFDGDGAFPAGTDIYGFSALPGGFGLPDGFGGRRDIYFNYAGSNGYWWSGTPCDDNHVYSRYMSCNNDNVLRYSSSKSYLFSVRCVLG